MPAYFLAIETSCDETAAAIFTDELQIRANVVASQTELHARFGGVVPEVAARARMLRLLPVIQQALEQAGVTLQQINAIVVLNTPGLGGALPGGRIIGRSDRFAAYPVDDPITPQSLAASLLHALGVDTTRTLRDGFDRAVRLSEGRIVPALFGG